MAMAGTLESPVLVLNKSWMPINATTVRESLVSAIADRARIICPETYELFEADRWFDLEVREGDRFIQSCRSKIRLPEVIVNEFNKLPNRTVHFSRRNLWKRDNWTCQYCGNIPPHDEITVDHVIPKSKKENLPPGVGLTSFENCVLACVKCNKKKDDKTPEQAGMQLRKTVKSANGTLQAVYYKRPKAPSWSPTYAVRRQKFPSSWKKFLLQKNDELYWNVELED